MVLAKAQSIVKSIGLLTMITCPVWVLALFYSGDFLYFSSLLLIPFIVALNVVLALRISRQDPFLHLVLPIAIIFKLAACGLYIYMVRNVLSGGGDVDSYFDSGSKIASLYATTGEWQFLVPFWSTNFVTMLSGALQIVIGPSFSSASVIFGMLSFWGEFFAYRAFCTAFPKGDRYLLGILLFFLPSIVFWPSTIGKDALIMLFIGLSVYGFALVNHDPSPKAFGYLILGLLGTMVVRPHIAAMLVISMTAPYLVANNRRGAAAALTKMVGFALLLGGTYFIAQQAKTFLQFDDVSGGMRAVDNVNRLNHYGDAAMGDDKSMFARAITAPVLLFRPFIWEVHNIPSTLASMEGFLLLLFTWRRRRELLEILRRWKIDSFAAFLVVYTVQFSIIFAGAMSNFGLLARQRVMLLPFALMLFTASFADWKSRALQGPAL
jgi:hypothetical protein